MSQKNFKVNNGLTTPQTVFQYDDGNVANLRNITVQPSNASANYTLTLPTGTGTSGQFLSTDGTGNLSWATGGGGGGASISNGNSNVNIASAGGNITVGSNGVANIITVTDGNLITGNGVGIILTSNNGTAIKQVQLKSSTNANFAANYSLTLPVAAPASNGLSLTANTDGTLAFTAPFVAQPTIKFTAASSGNNQTFTDANIANFGNSTAYSSVYRNGILIDNSQYTFSGTTLTVNVQLLANDTIYVSSTNVAAASIVGNGTTGGANTQVQFNDNGSFGGSSSFTYDKNTSLLSVPDLVVTGVVHGNLIPNVSNTYNLGNATNRWNSIYLANNTIYLGDQAIHADDANALVTFAGGIVANSTVNIGSNVLSMLDSLLHLNGVPLVATDSNLSMTINEITSTGNITSTGTVMVDGAIMSNTSIHSTGDLALGYANVVYTPNGSAIQFLGDGIAIGVTDSTGYGGFASAFGFTNSTGTLAGPATGVPFTITSGGGADMTVTSEGNTIITSSGYLANTNISSPQGEINITPAGNTNVSNLIVTGNLLPSANASYNLGSDTQRWNSIYLANNTIYLGNQDIHADDANNTVIFGNSIQANSNVIIGNSILSIDGTGALTVDGNALATSNTTGNISFSQSANVDLGNVGNIHITGGSSGQFLSTDGNGNLTWATSGGASTGDLAFTTNAMYSSNGVIVENANLTAPATAALLIPENGATSAVQLNNYYGNIVLSSTADGNSSNANSWTFGTDGTLSLPQAPSAAAAVIQPASTSYGIKIISNSNEFTYTTSGSLILPRGGNIGETNIPFGGLSGNTIALTPSGGTNADQQLLVYPTAGGDNNHLHLTSGNLYNTELFLGNDNLYVKLANTGDVVINSNDDVGNTAQWTFDTLGNITGPFSNTTIAAGSNDWVFDTTGNLTLPTNSFTINYANGTAVSLAGTYGDSNVTSLLGSLGANAISSTANITTTASVAFGGIKGNVVTISTDTTLTTNNYIVLASANCNVTLSAAESGRMFVIKNTQNAAANIVVAPASGTIDGGANYTVASPLQSITVTSDGTNWYVI